MINKIEYSELIWWHEKGGRTINLSEHWLGGHYFNDVKIVEFIIYKFENKYLLTKTNPLINECKILRIINREFSQMHILEKEIKDNQILLMLKKSAEIYSKQENSKDE